MNARGLFAALLLSAALTACTSQSQPQAQSQAQRPDFSGFWNLSRNAGEHDPALEKLLPEGTVEMKDTGAAEFGPMVFGGLELTPAAAAAARDWKPEIEMTLERVCRIPSIVYAVQGPFPIEIFQDTNLMVMRLEYFDMTRVIFLDGRDPNPEGMPNTKTGYSVGHFEGDVLVVTTTHLKEATITNNGLEHSDQMRVIERFRLSEDGKTLHATQEYEDPVMLENRGVRYINWTRVDGDHVHAYDCDPTFVEEYAK
ncbi:MAG: hypothetical protein LBE59_06090 [Nevskiaceae bacterium]|jgi:hypothetical protein|nr:hypothetical protein [Nevskiaceae bacterium]